MNAPERFALPDVQSEQDRRNIAIADVGVKDVRYPIVVRRSGDTLASVGIWTLSVALSPHVKGTHMSRFIEVLETAGALDGPAFVGLAERMLERLGAREGRVKVRFPYFIRKPAPISAVAGLLDYEVTWSANVNVDGKTAFRTKVLVPATSLCPCSKEISEYGAHNQRSHVMLDVELCEPMSIEDVVAIAESSASCEVFPLLKRIDEKYVTERAYDNPKFVEDIVRDAAAALDTDPRVSTYVVEAENFESIHNHSAFARVTGPASARHARECERYSL